MKLFFYGGEEFSAVRKIDKLLVENIKSTRPVVAYVPSCPKADLIYFKQFKRHFKKLGISRFLYCSLDNNFLKKNDSLERMFDSDVIYLSGGNTYDFLNHLKKKKLHLKFKKFAKKGKILCGASAGGILMTPSIKTAEVPSLDADINYSKIKNLKALSLVDFEFSPHHIEECSKSSKELLNYSLKIKRKIYACEDGGGLLVEGKRKKYIGDVFVYHQGKRYKKSSKKSSRKPLK